MRTLKENTFSQFGFGLIGVLLIIGALVITAGGVVVWEKKISPAVTMPSTNPIYSNGSKDCRSDGDCILIEEKTCLGGCESCEVLDYASPLFGAFSKEWCQKNQPEMKACPHCDIQRTNKENLKARCINGVCRKVK